MESNGSITKLCGAKTRKGGSCKMVAGERTDHLGFGTCYLHGGCTTTSKIHAAREAVVDKVEKWKKLGVVNEMVGPETALLEEVSRAAAAVAYFDNLVAEIEDPTTNRAQILIDQWNEQRRLSTQTSKLIVQAGIAKRHLQIQEMQATALVQIIMAVVGAPEMALNSEQQMIARKLMAGKLRELAAANVEPD